MSLKHGWIRFSDLGCVLRLEKVMLEAKNKKNLRLAVDICIAVFLLLLMSYQATGEKIHEWIGLGMIVSVSLHQILNLNWYKALVSGKGKWTAFRKAVTVTDFLLLISTALTAYSGAAMSAYAVPFLYGIGKLATVRRLHLVFSNWCFILAGIHFGLHLPSLEARFIKNERVQSIAATVFTGIAGIGVYMFIKNRILSYIFFIATFAYFEPGKPKPLIFIEYAFVYALWSFVGYMLAVNSHDK